MASLPESLNDQRVLSTRQGADMIGVSVNTFRRLYWTGKLPPVIQLSERRIGWRVVDLRAWLASREIAAA